MLARMQKKSNLCTLLIGMEISVVWWESICFLKNFKIKLLCDPAISLLDMYLSEWESSVQKNSCDSIHKIRWWNQPDVYHFFFLMWKLYNEILFSYKKKELLSLVANKTEPEDAGLRERCQAQGTRWGELSGDWKNNQMWQSKQNRGVNEGRAWEPRRERAVEGQRLLRCPTAQNSSCGLQD